MSKNKNKNKNKWFLNGGRGSGRTIRLLCEVYENKIANLERKLEQTEKDLFDYQFNYPTIIELEKEKAEFKEQLARITEERNGYKITVNSYEHTIKDLRKENAALKDGANKLLDKWCRGDDPCPHLKKRDDQLTKAKELLREIIDTPVFAQMGGELYKNEGYTELVEEAEQFLKELDK